MRPTTRSARRTPSARTTAQLAAGALAAATLLAAPAAAVTIPKIPRYQQATFAVSLTATQKTTWKATGRASMRDCMPLFRTTGEGTETVTMRTTRGARATLMKSGREATFLLHGSSLGVEVPTDASVTRQGILRTTEIAGSCGDNPEQTSDTGPYDCGPRNRDLIFKASYVRGRLGFEADQGLIAPLTPQRYENCPIFANPKVLTNDLTLATTRAPAGELLDRRFRKHIVLGRKSWKLDSKDATGTTTVSWKLTLVRRGR